MKHKLHRTQTSGISRFQIRLGAIYHGMFPSRHGHGFLKDWIHHLPVVVGLSLLVALLAHWGWFHGFQTLALDSLLLAQTSRRSDQVVIVTIGDEEFRSADLFKGTSPLDPQALGSLLQAIAAGKPRVIAVDLDTSSTAKIAEYQQLAEMSHGTDWPPVVWSADGEAEHGSHGGHGVPPLHVIPALAGDPLAVNGLIVMPSDADGVVRRYRRRFPVASDNHHEPAEADSLPWAVVKEYCRLTPESQRPPGLRHYGPTVPASHGASDVLMNFPGDRFTFTHISAQTVLDSSAKRDFWTSDKSPIRDKIVLLGGTYRAARDIHPTPVGQVAGVELLAMAVESELQGTGIRSVHEAISILIDILFGSVLVYLNWRFVSPRAIFLNLLAVGALALVASYITFNTLGYWLNFAVVLVGIWLHNQWHVANEIPSLHRQVHDLKKRLLVYEQESASRGPAPIPPLVSSTEEAV